MVDAKYYQGNLSHDTVTKTINDMELRKAYGIIVGSHTCTVPDGIKLEYQDGHKDISQEFFNQTLISGKENEYMTEYLI